MDDGINKFSSHKSLFNRTEGNNKLELDTHTFDDFSFIELNGELEEILSIPDITPCRLQHETIWPRIVQAYKKLRSKDSSPDGYKMLLLGYARSPFRDFECYLRNVVALDEDDIQLFLKQYNEKISTYEFSSGNYTFEVFLDAVYTVGAHEGTLQIEYDDVIKKRKPILTRFQSTFGTLRFIEKCFLRLLLKFAPYEDYKPTNAIHADSPGVYSSEKNFVFNYHK